MSTKTFFVNNGEANLGPFDMPTIVAMVNRLEIRATDHLCVDTEKDEWVMVCQHPDFVAIVSQAAKPTVKPTLKSVPSVKAIPDVKAESAPIPKTEMPAEPQTSTTSVSPEKAALPQVTMAKIDLVLLCMST
jgi:hypothetical protein